MPHTSRAWVMDVAAGWRVAAGAPQVVEYLLAPETIDVPRTPKHCAGLLIWRDRMIPVIDFAPLQTERTATTAKTRRAVILAYQDAPTQPLRYGALLVMAAPTEFWVSDDMAGPLAEMPAAFTHIARACFVQLGQVIPILDAHQLFTRPLLRLPASASATAPGAALPPLSMESDEVDERVIHLDESTFAEGMEPAAGEMPQSLSVVEDIQVWTGPWINEADHIGNNRSRLSQIEASLPDLPPEPACYDLQAGGMEVDESMDGPGTSPGTGKADGVGHERSTNPWMDEVDRVGNERSRPHREQAADEAVAAAYCVVLPFPSRSADVAPASPESVRLVEAGDLPEFVLTETVVPAETESFVAFDDEAMDGGGTSPRMDEVERAGSERSRPRPERAVEEQSAAPMDAGQDATAADAAQQERSNTLQSFQRLRAIEQAIEGRDLRPQHRRWQLLAAAVGLAILIGALFMFMDFSARAPAPAQESVARDVAPGGINPASVPSTPAQPPK